MAGGCHSPSRSSGFADEEGVRFASTLLGSRAVAGTFDESLLGKTDTAGVTMRQALAGFGLDPDHIGRAARTRRELLAYVELHIEQGPVLEGLNIPLGVVTAISGATRLAARLTGMAGHAGTVPMKQRKDALAGAAECIGAVEQFCRTDENGLVGTVGYIHAAPGATNVIPGQVSFTIDIRAPSDAHRTRAVADMVRQIESIARRRDLALQLDVTHENRSVPCADWLKRQIADAIASEGYRVLELPSGAGHDGMAMIDIADVGMVFVRCRGGISHHPGEHVDTADVDAGARALLRMIENFRPRDFAHEPRAMDRKAELATTSKTSGLSPGILFDASQTSRARCCSTLTVRSPTLTPYIWKRSTTSSRHAAMSSIVHAPRLSFRVSPMPRSGSGSCRTNRLSGKRPSWEKRKPSSEISLLGKYSPCRG